MKLRFDRIPENKEPRQMPWLFYYAYSFLSFFSITPLQAGVQGVGDVF